jgi:hypothetical protein
MFNTLLWKSAFHAGNVSHNRPDNIIVWRLDNSIFQVWDVYIKILGKWQRRREWSLTTCDLTFKSVLLSNVRLYKSDVRKNVSRYPRLQHQACIRI